MADAAEDARAIATELSISRLATWGHSGGGPYALACAALLPGVVVAACVFASLAPPDAAGLDYLGSWTDGDREEIELFFTQPELARELRWARAKERLAELSTAQGWLDMWGETADSVPPGRLAVARYLAQVQQDTLCRNDQGWWDDHVAYLGPWGFDPAAITVPVQLWHGDDDQAVPPVFGQWLAGHIPGVQAHLLAGEDHASIHDNHLAEAFGWLRQQL